MAVAILAAGHAAESAAPAPCPDVFDRTLQVIAVDEKLDFALADGRIGRLPGLDFGRGDHAAGARATFVQWLVGRDVAAADPVEKTDRWGRLSLWLAAPAGAGSPATASLAETALAAGLARYRPDAAARPCRARLLAAEAQARTARRGIWAHAPVILAEDRAGIVGAPPGMSVVEGKVASLGDATGRIYVNFGSVRAVDFAFTISRRNLTILEALGVEAQNLVGRHVRVRGLIDRRFGPQMEITSADAIELLDERKAP